MHETHPHFGSSGVGSKRNFRSSTLPASFAFLEPFIIVIIIIIIIIIIVIIIIIIIIIIFAGHLLGVLTSVKTVFTQLLTFSNHSGSRFSLDYIPSKRHDLFGHLISM